MQTLLKVEENAHLRRVLFEEGEAVAKERGGGR